jgi:Mn2+/Fe2+ NRAMP family transporter
LAYVTYSCILDASFIFLFLENYGVRKLEAFFAVLIATIAISFAVMFGETKPSGKELLIGKSRPVHRQNCLCLYCILTSKGVYSFHFSCRFGGSKIESKDH